MQDSDGWTPLHCASSCNNLPIAKLLIENGACIFATSLSDSETPAQKCEEAIKATQDVVSPSSVYDKCYVYLEKVEQCIGLVNDGKVRFNWFFVLFLLKSSWLVNQLTGGESSSN